MTSLEGDADKDAIKSLRDVIAFCIMPPKNNTGKLMGERFTIIAGVPVVEI
jgi:hypothetical protein